MKGLKKAMARGLWLALAAVLFAAVLAGCWYGDANGGRSEDMGKYGAFEKEGLSAETERQILRAYFDAYVKPYGSGADIHDSWVAKCLVLDGCVVVRIGNNYLSAAVIRGYVFIAGVPFYAEPIFVWKDGNLYELYDAYDLGILPKKEKFEGLSEEKERQIKQAYADIYLNDPWLKVDIEYIRIVQHTAVNGCDVVLTNRVENRDIKKTPLVIAGVPFYGEPILVWKDGQLYELQDAYDLGFLPKED